MHLLHLACKGLDGLAKSLGGLSIDVKRHRCPEGMVQRRGVGLCPLGARRIAGEVRIRTPLQQRPGQHVGLGIGARLVVPRRAGRDLYPGREDDGAAGKRQLG